MRVDSTELNEAMKNLLTVPAGFDVGSYDVDAKPITGNLFFKLSKILDLLPFKLCQVRWLFYESIALTSLNSVVAKDL